MEYHLDRFKQAQEIDYPVALREIKSGRKQSHWIWYIFPQLKGLGRSSMSDYYGIQGIGEAHAYINDPLLSQRLREISMALLEHDGKSARDIMGIPDDRKLKSSMTLFAAAAEDNQIFLDVLDRYFGGAQDTRTLRMLQRP